MQYCPDQTIVSTHGGSQGSLNEVGRNVPKSDEQVITDNVTIDVSPGAIQSNNAGSLRSNSVQVIKPARLPEIPLPTFEGDIYEWITFRDRFTTSVDRREHLSDIDKFYYLVGCCKGAARDAIRGIPVSDHNYKLAWSTLEERFNKPRLVACSLIEKLLNAQRASSESLVELNKLLVVFDEGVSLLESLNIPNLGDFILFSIASRCLPIYSIKLFEAQLANDPRLQRLYCDFMSEYLTLGHMSSAKSEGDYFIPHHAVYRPADIDPKIRVVFDASATSYSGVSLNDCLLPGPKLQRDVVDVLLLYRVHRFAFTTDISKMYRQVSVTPLHRRYQHILWRSSPEQMLQAYELNTVTYGVNCAPYLAIKVLRSIAEQDCNGFPFLKELYCYQTYVDDIWRGS
eukprot:XP_016658940.1 PREDICTED: uncharacterized protein LOC103309057 [Acyrthosiphon pisum]